MASALVDVRDPGLDRPLLWTVALLALAALVSLSRRARAAGPAV